MHFFLPPKNRRLLFVCLVLALEFTGRVGPSFSRGCINLPGPSASAAPELQKAHSSARKCTREQCEKQQSKYFIKVLLGHATDHHEASVEDMTLLLSYILFTDSLQEHKGILD